MFRENKPKVWVIVNSLVNRGGLESFVFLNTLNDKLFSVFCIYSGHFSLIPKLVTQSEIFVTKRKLFVKWKIFGFLF